MIGLGTSPALVSRPFVGKTRSLPMQRNCYLLIGILISAMPCFAEAPSWYWQEPQPPDHTVVGRSQRGIVQGPQMYFANGQLGVTYVDNQYVSDAIQKNIEYVSKVSADGGNNSAPDRRPTSRNRWRILPVAIQQYIASSQSARPTSEKRNAIGRGLLRLAESLRHVPEAG